MSASAPHHPSASTDADGVRVVATGSRDSWRRGVWPIFVLIVLVGAAWLLSRPQERGAASTESVHPTGASSSPSAPMTTPDVSASPAPTNPPVATIRRGPAVSAAVTASTADFTAPDTDPDDLARYFKPGDAEPTGAELIEALQDAGVKTGIAAFNPPGTVPPMVGLVVPPDFELPPGYVRHHQVTDQGEDIEPILMFAPDAQLFDAQGRPIALPENRVVPPELAPPGLPIREVTLPSS